MSKRKHPEDIAEETSQNKKMLNNNDDIVRRDNLAIINPKAKDFVPEVYDESAAIFDLPEDELLSEKKEEEDSLAKEEPEKEKKEKEEEEEDSLEKEDEDKYARVVDEDNGKFVIVHVSNEFARTTFKIKPDTSMRKLMKEFCRQRELEYGSIRFIFDGNRIKEEDTVRTIGIKSDEIIDALSTQIGGC